MLVSKVALVTLLLFASQVAGQRKPDFSGEWSLNKEKTRLQLQQLNAMEKAVVTIEHREPLFRLHRTFTIDGKDNSVSFELNADGKEVEREEGTRRLFSRLYWESESLVFSTRILAAEGEATNVVRYSLLENGRVLRAAELFRGPRFSYENLWVFDRK